MKKIYEIPEVITFKVGVRQMMLQQSPTIQLGIDSSGENTVESGSNWGNSNYLDDQSTPWYRR